jgi:hypothetical protein
MSANRQQDSSANNTTQLQTAVDLASVTAVNDSINDVITKSTVAWLLAGSTGGRETRSCRPTCTSPGRIFFEADVLTDSKIG